MKTEDILIEGHRYIYQRINGELVLTDETKFDEKVKDEVEKLKEK